MAGKKYQLPRPRPDVQPKSAGADEVGYEQGLRPRARYAVSNATATWRGASPGVTRQLHCNIVPRISLADAMDVETARRWGVSPHVPGRRPAPRIEVGCVEPPTELDVKAGALARDLSFSGFRGTSVNPDGGPRSGPRPGMPGLIPLPKPPPSVPRQPPTIPPVEVPPVVEPAPPGSELPGAPPISPRIPGTIQAVNFHFTGDIVGGAAASELRVFGPVGSPFVIKQIWINPDSGVSPGQFLDVMVSNDTSTSDVATPSGESIFPLLEGVGSIPSPDGERGMAVPPTAQLLDLAYRVDLLNASLKLRVYFIAPALALPNIHVTLVIEHMDLPGQSPPPLMPRPPIDSPYAPRSVPQPTSPSYPTSAIGSFVPDPGERWPLLPAWRVAALGLEFVPTGGTLAVYPLVDSYASWLVSPYGMGGAMFVERIEAVLSAAQGTAGAWNTYVDHTLAPPLGG